MSELMIYFSINNSLSNNYKTADCRLLTVAYIALGNYYKTNGSIMIPNCCTIRGIIGVEIFSNHFETSPVKGEISSSFALNRAIRCLGLISFYPYYAPNGAATWNRN
jgi:hypothetical protein